MKVYFKSWLTILALALAVLVTIILASQPTHAAGPWYVTPGGDDGNDCLSPATACATINGAITKASPGDTIYVATGTYTGTGDEVVLLDKDATLSGGWDASFVTQSGASTIDGEGSRRGMTVNNGVTAIVERFTVQSGSATGGGGISNDGTLTLNNSTVSGNTGFYGGGISNGYNGTMTLNNSTVSGNTTGYQGGGILNSGIMTLNNSTVSGNTADSGGGIRNGGGLTLNNSTVSGNTADSGGGIHRGGGTVTLQNSILANNTAGSGPDCVNTIGTLGYNLIGDTSGCTFTPISGDLTNVSASLGPLIGSPGYHPLLLDSPAIDAGNPAGCTGSTGPLTTDQRGAARVGRCDMGAYEYTIPGLAASIYALGGTPQRTPPFSVFKTHLQAVVLDSIGSPMSNTLVTFSAPASGASGTFADSGTFTTTAVTDEGGVATAATFMANGLEGSYTVTAMVSGVFTPANFLLTNIGWYVTPDGDDANDCQSPATPCATINGVLGKVDLTAGDTVLVATGTYTGTDSEVVLLDKNVTLSGGWDGTFTTQSDTSTIDGQASRRGITVNGGVTAIVERFTVQNGYTGGYGGGILNEGTLTLNNSTVSGNTANHGGGIYNYGTLTLNNSTVSGNTTGYQGGGIYNYIDTGTLTLNNSTVSGNMAGSSGGGINAPDGAVTQNTILAGNTASGAGPDCSGTIGSSGHNLIGDTSGCTFIPISGDLTNIDAKLGPLQDNGGPTETHALLSGSPAIDTGNDSACPATDQRGVPRPQGDQCDIGAVEMQELELSNKAVNASAVLPGTPLTYTITLRNIGGATVSNARVTDTLPIFLTYIDDSLSATSGSYGYSSGVITWTGSVNAGEAVAITFGATVSQTAPLGYIVNSAVISGGGEIITRTATVSVEGQICNLTKYTGNPILSTGAGGSWDDDDVRSPAVLKEGGSYKMWYTGDDSSGPSRIGLAASTNGTNWTKDAANPVLSPSETWETNGVMAGGVISDSGLYKMWYTGFDSSGVGRIGYATSPDGVAWTKYGSNPVLGVGASGGWEDEDVMEPTVIKEGGTYHMWYRGYDGITARIGHATSSNGTSWTKDTGNPVLDIGPPGGWDWLDVYGPSVVKVGAEYKLWYSGETLPQAWQTGYALSPNGSDWTRGGMLIPEGAPGTFDADSADYASVIVDGAGFKVWYSGLNDTGTYNIGYATAEICGASAAPPGGTLVYLPIVMKGAGACPAYYTDDFRDPGSGWPVDDDSNRRYAYTGGQYQIWVKKPSQGWLVTPGAKATDFTAAVSARRTSGTYGAYGIIFGLNEDWSEFYEFDIGPNNYSIWKLDFGWEWTPLRNWTSSGHIKTGTSWNRLKVIREGANIAVYVNGQYLTTVTDGSFTGLRRIGLVAYSPSSGSLDARFDDFSLYPASCGPDVTAAAVDFEMSVPEIHGGPMPPGLDRLP